MSLDDMKAKNKGGQYDKLMNVMNKTTAGKKKSHEEEDVWYPQRDKAGNATAIIRFLPGLESEGEPVFIESISHGFKGGGNKWYFQQCPTFLERDCPVCDMNKKMVEDNGDDYDLLDEKIKKVISSRSRKIIYYTNILVIEDSATPDNEGKVFKFKFGKKILKKYTAMANPKFKSDPVVMVFDYENGANFKLVVKKEKGWANYDDSTFDAPTALDAKTIERVKKEQFPLEHYRSPSLYKDYDFLRNKLVAVVGKENVAPSAVAESIVDDQADSMSNESSASTPEQSTPPVKEEAKIPSMDDKLPHEEESTDGGGDDMDFFKNLASQGKK